MIGFDALVLTIHGLDRAEVEHWIAQDWLRPHGAPGKWRFSEIDVARIHLLRELRHDLGVEEDGLPVVLHLLDQLYDTRRQLLRLRDALGTAPDETRRAILLALQPGTMP